MNDSVSFKIFVDPAKGQPKAVDLEAAKALGPRDGRFLKGFGWICLVFQAFLEVFQPQMAIAKGLEGGGGNKPGGERPGSLHAGRLRVLFV